MPMLSEVERVISLNYKYFCPRCGRETVYREEYHGLCDDCYRELYGSKILSGREIELKIKVCKVCGAVYFGGEWNKLNANGLKRIIKSLLKRNYKELKTFDIDVQLGELKDVWELLNKEIEVKIIDKLGNPVDKRRVYLRPIWGFCDKCQLKMSGEYWELIIRIRFKKDSKYDESFFYSYLSSLNLGSFEDYVKTVKVKDGVDIYFTDRAMGKKVLKSLASRLGVTPKKFLQKKLFKILKKTLLVENYVINV